MANILTDLSTPAIVAAIEENLFQFFSFLHHAPQIEIHDDPDMLWAITDIPFPLFNPVVRARLSAVNADAAIEMAIARYQQRNVPMLWWTGPSTQPSDLGVRLQAHGMLHAGDSPGMAVELHKLTTAIPRPIDMRVTPVHDRETLQTWCRVLVLGFDMPDFVGTALFDFFAAIGFGPHIPLRHYLGWFGEKPVATASLFLGAGVAGIYNVATTPEARRQGFGSTLTTTALQDAQAVQYRVGILHASPMGMGVYRRLGFQEYCTISQYLWADEQTHTTAG